MGTPITDPQAIEHPALRELALEAAWVAKLEDAADALEDIVEDLAEPVADPGGDGSGEARPVDDEEDPLRLALSVVASARDDTEAALEGRLAGWLAEDPEHWPIFRLALLDAWRDERGGLNQSVPGWVRALTTNAALAHVQHDPYGRRRELDLDF